MRRPKEEASYCLPVTYLHADHLGSTVLTAG